MLSYQTIIYLVLVFSCLVLSIRYKKEKKPRLYLYFALVFLVEMISALKLIENNMLHSYTILFYISFFTYYFSKISMSFKKQILFFGGITFASALIIKIFSNKSFPIEIGVVLSIFYIILSIIFFYEQVNKEQEGLITDKESFWVSSALLFWSVFFIFRVIPMYSLVQNNIDFLKSIGIIYQVAVIVTYIIFLISTTRKKI